MKGYWFVVSGGITDADARQEYGRLWKPIAEKYKAKINPMAEPVMMPEVHGTERVVVVEFPSLADAKACYEDPAYQEAKEFAIKASQRELFIFEAG